MKAAIVQVCLGGGEMIIQIRVEEDNSLWLSVVLLVWWIAKNAK